MPTADKFRILPALAVVVSFVSGASSCASRSTGTAEPTRADIERLRLGSIMAWSPADQRLGYPNIEKLAPTSRVRRSRTPFALTAAPRDLSQFRYTHAGATRTIDEFMLAMKAVGVIAVRDNAILLERYADAPGRTYTVDGVPTNRSLSDYLTEFVWQPFGMESDAHWLTMRGENIEHGDCCLSLTLRDNARVGLFELRGGTARDGTRLLPEGWMAESTRPSPAFPGYGYYWWLRKGGGYFASGSFGQHIEVDPATRTVVAIQSYWPAAYNDDLIAHNDRFVAALIAALR